MRVGDRYREADGQRASRLDVDVADSEKRCDASAGDLFPLQDPSVRARETVRQAGRQKLDGRAPPHDAGDEEAGGHGDDESEWRPALLRAALEKLHESPTAHAKRETRDRKVSRAGQSELVHPIVSSVHRVDAERE